MASKHFPSLAAVAFAAMLFHFFLKRRSREISKGEANNDAAANSGTAGSASGAHAPAGLPEMATSSGPAKDAAANDGTEGGDSSAYTLTGVPEMATSSGPAKDAAVNDGTAGGGAGAFPSIGVPEMATSSGPAKDAATKDGTAGGDTGAHTSTGVPEMATSIGYDYEVFLSFRGPDTREAFTDYLYTNLKNAGIRTFKDDEDLRIGEDFALELPQAIKQSKILIPIFSKGYATSVWCLKEVVQMVESNKTGGQKIVPIFYDVSPAEVRYQTGGYGEAFRLHESKKRYDQNTIGEWKAALSAIGAIHGRDLHKMNNRREGEFTQQLTEMIFKELKKAYLVVSNCLVNVDNHVDAIMRLIGAQTNETRIVGIHGMGGIGKTTTAKIIYNRLSENFEGCCFLSNIRETSERKGIECLQNQLISDILRNKCTDVRNIDDGIKIIKDRLSNKRVLLLLDDLYGKNHMDALVGERDWFGKGSKLVITTRNKEALDILEVDNYYELTGMDRDQSLQLFSKHAFRRNSPLDEYIDQSNRAIDIAGGLPLALEVIGSLLSRTEKKMWDLQLKKLGNVPHVEVQSKLRISYDALNLPQQHMFLDIACLFIGYDKDILVHFWDEPNFSPEVDMEFLQNLSLIKVNEDNKVWMHDQIRDLGREMVRQKSDMNVKKQSRVWDPKVGLDLLRKHKGKKEVQALRVKLERQSRYCLTYCFTYEGFQSLSDLRFLEVDGWMDFPAEKRLLWHKSRSNVLPTNENSDFLPHLRWLSWSDFPVALNTAIFFTEDLVILNLSESEITDDWIGWSHMKVMKNLKVLNLSKCRNLKRLPDELGRELTSLEYLSVNTCEWMKRLPDSIGNLESLIELDISQTDIEKLPDSIGKLKNLKRLKMRECDIKEIPDALWTIEKLEEVEASIKLCVNFHVNIGNCISKNQSMRILRLDGADLIALPRLPESLVELKLSELKMDTFPDLSNLTNLKELDLSFPSWYSNGECPNPMPRWIENLSKLESLHLVSPHVTTSPTGLALPPHLKSLSLECPKLRCLPRLPSSLSSLHLYKCKSLCSLEESDGLVESLQTDFTLPPHLKELRLEYCPNLRRLPRFPSTLSFLSLEHCHSSLSSLEDPSSLPVSCSAIEEIHRLDCFKNLRDVTLVGLEQVKILPDLSNLNRLASVRVESCGNLVEIQGKLPRFLDKLCIAKCGSLHNLPDLSSLIGKREVQIQYCNKLNVKSILGFAQINPRDLRLLGFGQLHILPDLSNSRELIRLEVHDCLNLIEIQGELPKSLEVLDIFYCDSLQKLPDLSSLKELRVLSIKGCNELKGEAILGSAQRSKVNLWENLQYLRICGLEQMEILPDLSNLNKLRSLLVSECVNLVEIQGELPWFLDELRISSCDSLQNLPDLSSLMGKKEVQIQYCSKLNVEAVLEFAHINPEDLRLLGFGQLHILPDLSDLSELRRLEVYDCHNLIEIQGKLPQSLEELDIFYCDSLQKLPDLSSLNGLQNVNIKGCKELKGEAILGSARKSKANLWTNLQYLRICCLEQVEILPDLSNLNKLKYLQVQSCDNLVEIQGELPESLIELGISSCKSLQKLPDLSSLNRLQMVAVEGCTKLNAEAISSLRLKKSVKFERQDRMGQRRRESEYEGEDAKSESEYEGEDRMGQRRHVSEYEGEHAESESEYEKDDEHEYESEGEDAESESESEYEKDDEHEYESEGEDAESVSEYGGDDEHVYESEGEEDG